MQLLGGGGGRVQLLPGLQQPHDVPLDKNSSRGCLTEVFLLDKTRLEGSIKTFKCLNWNLSPIAA